MVQYDLDTDTRHYGKIGTTSIPVPDTTVTSVRFGVPETSLMVLYRIPGVLPYGSRSVRPQYTTEPSGIVRYELDTGTGHYGKFGATSIPVPDTPVRVLYRVSGVLTLLKWFGTAYIPYRTIRYRWV